MEKSRWTNLKSDWPYPELEKPGLTEVEMELVIIISRWTNLNVDVALFQARKTSLEWDAEKPLNQSQNRKGLKQSQKNQTRPRTIWRDFKVYKASPKRFIVRGEIWGGIMWSIEKNNDTLIWEIYKILLIFQLRQSMILRLFKWVKREEAFWKNVNRDF